MIRSCRGLQPLAYQAEKLGTYFERIFESEAEKACTPAARLLSEQDEKMSTTEQAQKCPKCKRAAEIHNTKPGRWFVACSRNREIPRGHRVVRHPMFTKREGIAEWNRLTSTAV